MVMYRKGIRTCFPQGHGLKQLGNINSISQYQEFSYFSSKVAIFLKSCMCKTSKSEQLTFYYLCLCFFLLPKLEAYNLNLLCPFTYLTDTWFSLPAVTISPWKKVQIFPSRPYSDVTTTELGIYNSVFLQQLVHVYNVVL